MEVNTSLPILALIIAFVSLSIAFVSLYRTRKQHELENQYAEISSKLDNFQLRILEREEVENNSADIVAYFYQDANPLYKIELINSGHKSAKNVQFTLNLPEGDTSPLIESDVNAKLPIKVLHPKSTVNLQTSITLEMTPTLDAQLSWTNPDGTTVRKEFTLRLPC